MTSLLWQSIGLALAVFSAIAATLVIPNPSVKKALLAGIGIVSLLGLLLFAKLARDDSTEPAIKENLSRANETRNLSPSAPQVNQENQPSKSAEEKPPQQPESDAREIYSRSADGQQKDTLCSRDNQERHYLIARISNLQTRDFEYGTFILDLLGCKSYLNAVSAATKMSSLAERDGALSKIAIEAMKSHSYEPARQAVFKLSSLTTRDLLTSILINEMNRPQGSYADNGTFATDLVKLNFGTLGSATYDHRTGRVLDESFPCARGRASCNPQSSNLYTGDGWDRNDDQKQ